MSRHVANSDALARLRDRFDRTLAVQLRGATHVALLDFPNHDNVGDSAIWWGQVQALRRLGVRVLYASDLHRFSTSCVRRLPPDAPLLLHGGGNFGDLWVSYQQFRERIARDFPQRRIVQLPQSIHFASDHRAQQAADILGAHPDLSVLVRDLESQRIARTQLGLSAVLCPDAAFAIDPATLAAQRPPVDAVVRLWRTDKESRGPGTSLASRPPSVDWFVSGHRRLFRRTFRVLHAAEASPIAGRGVSRLSVSAHDRVAAWEVARGVRMLDQGRVVVTDRLHAVILSLLSGHPVIWSDNTYRKVERVLSTWLPDAADCTQMPDRRSASDAAATAQEQPA